MFLLSPSPIDPNTLKAALITPECGALVIFEGLVRNHNDGRPVAKLTYEAHEVLCMNEAQKVFNEAHSKFPIVKSQCVHRIGELKINDIAVWVAVSSHHRDEAFKACRYIIDEIKHRLPIWKKEFYTDGQAQWVNCAACSNPQGHTH